MEIIKSQICFQCGSDLVMLDTTIAFPQHTQSATTTVRYRCTNTVCQDRIDVKMADLAKLRMEREVREVAKIELLTQIRAKAKEAKVLLEATKTEQKTKMLKATP